MGILSEILEMITGKVHLYITVGDSPAVEVILKDKEIIADIKNPVLAFEFGIDQMLKRRAPRDSFILKRVKNSGYKVKIRYKLLEIEL